ncbi:MAG: Crp/Fnr family transcriptional regulator [Caulobacteraceae bacterium]
MQGIWFPLEGLISVVTLLADGGSLESAIVGREGCVGYIECAGSGVAYSRSVVQHPLKALLLPLAKARELQRAQPLNFAPMHLAAECITAHSQQSVVCHGQHQLQPRLARWLLTAQDRACESELQFTQQILSEMLGVQRTTVSDVAGALQERGLIRYSRGKVRILDRDGLARAACECYEAVRSHEARVWAEGMH